MAIVAGAPVLRCGGLLITALAFLPDWFQSIYSKIHVHESELGDFLPGCGGAALRPAATPARAAGGISMRAGR